MKKAIIISASIGMMFAGILGAKAAQSDVSSLKLDSSADYAIGDTLKGFLTKLKNLGADIPARFKSALDSFNNTVDELAEGMAGSDAPQDPKVNAALERARAAFMQAQDNLGQAKNEVENAKRINAEARARAGQAVRATGK